MVQVFCRELGVSIFCVFYVIILMSLMDGVRSAGGDHYPDEKYNRKPCFRRKNTIRFQGPICQVVNGGFTEESRKNCEDSFRISECPEMNFGTCELWNISALLTANSKLGTQNIGMCRLYYKADDSTWAEIWYLNQYSPLESDKPVWDIVEYRRNVIRTPVFGDRNQNGWPDNVPNPFGDRGLNWFSPFSAQADLPVITTDPAMCAGVENPGSVDDTRCSKNLQVYLSNLVIPNVDIITKTENNGPIEKSTFELAHNANITYELNMQCRNILVNAKRTPACQGIFVRRARFEYSTNEGAGIAPVTKVHDSSFEFLEYQIYNLPGANYTIQHAFWSLEPTETRDEIFSNGA